MTLCDDDRRVSVLYAHRRSVYFDLPVIVFDERRDALTAPLHGGPVIAHPPCRLWCRLRGLARAPESERAHAWRALQVVRARGGVLEHPARSKFFDAARLPWPGEHDEWGFTLHVDQRWWGHRVRKPTWLYIVGVGLRDVPEMPERTHGPCISWSELRADESELTPLAFAYWLEELAGRARRKPERPGVEPEGSIAKPETAGASLNAWGSKLNEPGGRLTQ